MLVLDDNIDQGRKTARFIRERLEEHIPIGYSVCKDVYDAKQIFDGTLKPFYFKMLREFGNADGGMNYNGFILQDPYHLSCKPDIVVADLMGYEKILKGYERDSDPEIQKHGRQFPKEVGHLLADYAISEGVGLVILNSLSFDLENSSRDRLVSKFESSIPGLKCFGRDQVESGRMLEHLEREVSSMGVMKNVIG